MSDVIYRTVSGFVFGGPYERDAGSRKVRDYLISVPGPLVNSEGQVTSVPDTKVRVTVWDSHGDVEVAEGDYIVASGKFEIFPGQDRDGNPENRYSVSANKLRNFGSGLGEFKDRGLENAKPSPGTRVKRTFDDIPGL